MSGTTTTGPAHRGVLVRLLSYPQVWFLIVLLGLAVMGMAVASRFQEKGRATWIVIAFGYALVGIAVGWPGTRARRESVWGLVYRNASHWAATGLSLGVLFAMERQEFIERNETAAVAVLMLSLACLLAGVHLHWLFLVVAVFLASLAIVDVKVTEDFWLILFLLVAISAALVGVLVLMRGRGGSTSH